MAWGQSFFTATTLPQSLEYGKTSTRLVPEGIVELIEKEDFGFEQWSSFYFIQSEPGGAPIRGRYGVENNHLVFMPANAPDPNAQYFVTFSYPNLNKLLGGYIEAEGEYTDIASFHPPENTRPSVLSFDPNMNEVPANLLRFYIYFSAPMSPEQNPYDYITLLDEAGRPLEQPFIIIPEGLWNINHTRLTLLLHPASVSQDKSSDDYGDVLKAGNSYTLKISKEWIGASGEPLQSDFEKTFNASNLLRGAMNIDKWALRAERKNIGVLHVVTDHPLDQPLAKRMLFIRSETGQILPSRVEFENPEKLKVLWQLDGSETLELLIDPRLEDVCGNTPHYAFDLEGSDHTPSTQELKLKFRLD